MQKLATTLSPLISWVMTDAQQITNASFKNWYTVTGTQCAEDPECMY